MLPFWLIKTSAELEAINCTLSALNSHVCFVSQTAARVSPSSSHRIAWIRFTVRASMLQSERHVNKMVLWPGCGGRGKFSLHTKNVQSVWFVVKRYTPASTPAFGSVDPPVCAELRISFIILFNLIARVLQCFSLGITFRGRFFSFS